MATNASTDRADADQAAADGKPAAARAFAPTVFNVVAFTLVIKAHDHSSCKRVDKSDVQLLLSFRQGMPESRTRDGLQPYLHLPVTGFRHSLPERQVVPTEKKLHVGLDK